CYCLHGCRGQLSARPISRSSCLKSTSRTSLRPEQYPPVFLMRWRSQFRTCLRSRFQVVKIPDIYTVLQGRPTLWVILERLTKWSLTGWGPIECRSALQRPMESRTPSCSGNEASEGGPERCRH